MHLIELWFTHQISVMHLIEVWFTHPTLVMHLIELWLPWVRWVSQS